MITVAVGIACFAAGALGMAFAHTFMGLKLKASPNMGQRPAGWMYVAGPFRTVSPERLNDEHPWSEMQEVPLYGIEAGQVDDLLRGSGFQ